MKIFQLEAVVKILTGGADKQLSALEQKGISLDNSMTTNFKNIGAEALKLAGPAILGALGAALASIGAAAIKLGTELADAMNVYQVETGASAAETAAFADQLTNLWQNNTDGIGELTDAIVAVRRAFGDLGDEQEAVTQDLLDFAKVTGSDVVRSTQGAASVLRQYGLELKDLPQLLDTLARNQQVTGASADKVLESLKRSGPVIQGLGLSIQEAAAFFGVLEMNGAGAEATTMSLIKILQASTATTEAQADAFRTLGIALDETGRPLGGAEAVFKQLIPQIERGEVTGDKLAAAFAIMGEGAKELIPALAASRKSVEELSGEVTDSAGTVTEASATFDRQLGERLPLLFKMAFGDSISAAAKVGADAIGTLLDALEWIIRKLQEVGTFAGGVAYGIEASYRVAAGTVKDVFDAMVDAVLDSFRYVLDQINSGIDALPASMQERLGGVRESLGSLREELGESRGVSIAEAVLGRKDDWVNPLQAGRDALAELWDEQKAASASYGEMKKEIEDTGGAVVELSDAAISANEKLRIAIIKNTEGETAAKLAELEAQKKAYEDAGADRVAIEEWYASEKARITKEGADKEAKEAQKVADEQQKMADELARTHEELRISIIRNTQGETAAQLAELETRKRAYEQAGADRLAVDRWYAEESKRIREEARVKESEELKRVSEEQFAAAQQAAQLEADLLEANGNTLAAKLANLDIEKEAFLRTAKDKAKAEELFAKRREEIIKQSAEQAAKIEEELTLKTMEARGQTEEARNMRELARIRETVEAARAAGVEEVKIAEYIAAEQKRIRDGAKAEEKKEESKGASSSPLMSAEEAFSGMSGFNFSIGGGKKGSKSDPASARAANELASQVGQLANGNSAVSGENKPTDTVVVIRIEDGSGQVLSTSRLSGADADEVIQDYQLGGL